MPKRIFRFSAFCLVFVLAAALCSCTARQGAAKKTVAANFTDLSGGEDRFRFAEDMKYKKIASDSNGVLLFDPATGSISVRYSENGRHFSALPEVKNGTAAVLEAVLITGEGEVKLDSQSNGAALSAPEYSEEDGVLTVVYTLAENSGAAEKNGGAFVRVPVRYALADGVLTVGTDLVLCETSEDTVIESLSLLPYFGSVNYDREPSASPLTEDVPAAAETEEETEEHAEEEPVEETVEQEPEEEPAGTPAASQSIYELMADYFTDFLFVPDGPGALIYTKATEPDYDRLAFAVYGSEKNDVYEAPLGAFGVKKDSESFIAVITEGEAIAEIVTESAGKETENTYTVYPRFVVTPTAENGETLICGASYTGRLSVSYRFLSGQNAEAGGMAAAARALLIRHGFLTEKTIPDAVMPVNVEIVGSTDGTKKTTVSDFESAEDFLNVLKAKGLNNVNLLLKGFLSGGLVPDDPSDVSLIGSAGSGAEFEELCSYAGKQGYKVSLAARLLTSSSSARAAQDLNGKKISVRFDDPLGAVGNASLTAYRQSAAQTEKNTLGFLNAMRKNPADGYVLCDVNASVMTETSAAASDRDALSRLLSENAASVGRIKDLTVEGCHFNTLAFARAVTDMPCYTSFTPSASYCAYPFIQSVLHGSLLCSGTAINRAALPRLEMLKCVEYGLVPYFSWTLSGSQPTYYENSFAEAVEFCLEATEDLSDLTDKRIVSHREVESGVFLTGYSSGSLVYVNFNNYSVNMGDIAVMPYDYIRIN